MEDYSPREWGEGEEVNALEAVVSGWVEWQGG